MSYMRNLLRPASTTVRTFSSSARNNYAKLAVIGRLVREPEAHASSTGRTFIKYSIATSHGPRDSERSSFWNVTSFPTSDAQKDYLLNLPKGSLVHVEADAEMQKYEVSSEGEMQDPEDKSFRRSLSLIQRNLEVLGRPKPAQTTADAPEPQAASA
ncbi:uncharacterized protein PV09_00439 [Verruconis gallopava]|uniref:Nucleic acid-binding protein n=1 Tax=Verruconis gallopava TaxID=253628 RepID=A0A0D1Y3R9_9PEZI|nr:uncharacterized protein PV09_00439 [Verruconis gallopava]KIW09566.1 hypothetical protein PV09_00439 [Verruconis gallopava]